MKTYDAIGMTEVWIEEKYWKNWEKKLPKDFEWEYQYAIRENKKGRAKGGILTGVRRTIKTEKTMLKHENGIQERNMLLNDVKWRMFTLYNDMNLKRIVDELNNIIEECEDDIIIITKKE